MKVLLLNQAFYPDVVATGQYLTPLALSLARRGHEVTVVTSRRGYDDPSRTFPAREEWQGIRICRVPVTNFGKTARWRRGLDFASFMLSCWWRVFWLARQNAVVALTSPPLIAVLAAWLAGWWRIPFIYWMMDFNPDEAAAAGWLRPNSLLFRVLDSLSRYSLRRAARVIVLDRFMRERVLAKGIDPAKVVVLSPWAHDGQVRFDPEGRERFRKQHGLDGKCVIMYSGNHTPVHSLATLCTAAERLSQEPDWVFCFVGGGSEWRALRDRVTTSQRPGNFSHANVRCLPYQPLEALAASLSAADIQVVVMGEPMVGVVHPSKVYNLLQVGVPMLYLGPEISPVADIMERTKQTRCWAHARHGDVDAVVAAIRHLRQLRRSFSADSGGAIEPWSQGAILPSLIQEIERLATSCAAPDGRR